MRELSLKVPLLLKGAGDILLFDYSCCFIIPLNIDVLFLGTGGGTGEFSWDYWWWAFNIV